MPQNAGSALSVHENGSVNGQGERASGPLARRRLASRLSRDHWLALVAAAVAFVAVFSALRDRRETAVIAVASEPIPVAMRVDAGMFRSVELPADSPLLSTMVDMDAVASGGFVTTRPVAAGEALTTGAVADDLPADGLRSMSVPVAREHAAGGSLRAGDRVDVLGAADGGAVVDFVATDLEVLTVSEEQTGAVGSRPTEFAVTVAVDGTDALGLARAMTSESLEVVRSTGAVPLGDPVAAAGPAGD